MKPCLAFIVLWPGGGPTEIVDAWSGGDEGRFVGVHSRQAESTRRSGDRTTGRSAHRVPPYSESLKRRPKLA